MPQNPIPVLTVAPVDTSPLQEPINLQTGGNLVLVGAPGGPVVFARYGSVIIPGLSGSPLRGVAK